MEDCRLAIIGRGDVGRFDRLPVRAPDPIIVGIQNSTARIKESHGGILKRVRYRMGEGGLKSPQQDACPATALDDELRDNDIIAKARDEARAYADQISRRGGTRNGDQEEQGEAEE